ncbi:MAG: sigma-70 family RNA polymerase sigma factor [Nocardioides sp.]|uniref:sigma-70 family RNA polymerase sigma factor n=1 Tax=Nocardioides sp. TaxID=35761 RepID=UPI0032650A60
MSLTLQPSSSQARLTRSARAAATSDLLARLDDPACSRRQVEDEIIRINLVVAMQEARRYEGRGIDKEDLRQVASLGLVKAARSFDPTLGTDFLSFAVPTIRGELRRWFRDRGWMVRPPRPVQDLQAGIIAAQDTLVQEFGRTARPSELAAHLSVDVDQVIEAVSASGLFTVDSLDVKLSGGRAPHDRLAFRDTGFASAEARIVLGPLVRELSSRERRILELRFFQGASQAEIGEQLGVTQAQVSRLLTSICRRLRQRLQASRRGTATIRPDLDPAA